MALDPPRLAAAASAVEKGDDTMKSRALLWMLLGPVTAVITAITMMIMFVVVFAATLAAVGAIVTAVMKREDWTMPAYRWARDRSGRWSMTPWSSADGATSVERETAV